MKRCPECSHDMQVVQLIHKGSTDEWFQLWSCISCPHDETIQVREEET